MSGLQMSDIELAFVCQQFFGGDLVNWSEELPIYLGKCQPSSSTLLSNILKAQVSVFFALIPARHTKSGKPWQAGIQNTWFKKDLPLLQVYNLIKSDKFKARTEKLRTIKNEDDNRAYKQKYFSYACFSGTFAQRNDKSLINHSHLTCIDLDHLPDVRAIREKIIREAIPDHFVMLFTSPNGNGLKVIFHSEDINADTQSDCYEYFANYLAELCHLTANCVDTSCQDVSRACFLPYDPNIFLNHKLL